MAELNLPPYSKDDLSRVRDHDMIELLKCLIDDVMVENRLYYDDDDRSVAVEIIYPIISVIVFNSSFWRVRCDKKCLVDLVTHLA